jgi:SAM-dependent methyltransferase
MRSRLSHVEPPWKIAYWRFQHDLTRRHIVPFLERHGALPAQGRVLEVGAGEGGCLAALQQATGLPADGLELSASRSELARAIGAVLAGGRLRVHQGDITRDADLARLSPPYALILLRDVIEHIEAIDVALANIRSLLDGAGALLLTFPPFYSPFGAHQQILRRRALRLPWIQLLPVFPWMVRTWEPNEGTRREIEGIRRCRLTIARLERSLGRAQLEISARADYILRPALHYRYGFPVIGGGVVAKIPGLREVVLTGAWYLVRPTGRAVGSAERP